MSTGGATGDPIATNFLSSIPLLFPYDPKYCQGDSSGFLVTSSWFLSRLILLSWRWRRNVLTKSRLNFHGLHGVILQETVIIMTTAVISYSKLSEPGLYTCEARHKIGLHRNLSFSSLLFLLLPPPCQFYDPPLAFIERGEKTEKCFASTFLD